MGWCARYISQNGAASMCYVRDSMIENTGMIFEIHTNIIVS